MGNARKYDSTGRREQAAITRERILAAAEKRFVRDAYSGTSVGAVAAEAGVSLRTVYLHFPAKSEILRALWNARLRGDEQDLAVEQREWFRAVIDEPDPAAQIRQNMRNSVTVKKRVGALFDVLRDAATTDPQIASLWDRIADEYRTNQLAIAKSIAKKKALKRGVDVELAADLLWSLNHPDYYDLLCTRRKWSIETYEQRVGDLLCDQLLRQSA